MKYTRRFFVKATRSYSFLFLNNTFFPFSFAIQIKLYWCLIYSDVSSIEKVCYNFSKNFISTWRFVLYVWIIQPFALVLSYLRWKQGYKIGNTDVVKFDFGIEWNTPEIDICFVISIRKKLIIFDSIKPRFVVINNIYL